MRKNKQEKQDDFDFKDNFKSEPKLIALKDFKFVHNDFKYDFKKGEEVIVDDKFLDILKTEKVIN